MSEMYINDVYMPYIDDDTRVQIFFGGSSSGKSVFLAQRTVLDVLKGLRNYLVIRNVASTIKRSVFNEIMKVIYDNNLSREFTVNKSDLVITCNRNRKQIVFAGLDDVEKLKSITPIDGPLTDVWVEEATETEHSAIKQLFKRLRGRSKVNKRVILSFNPITQDHWIYNEYFSDWVDGKNVLRQEKLLIVKSTYKDNKFLEEDDIYELENEKDEYYRNVYTYGNWGIIGNVIYKNWSVEDLSWLKGRVDVHKYGLDFGFSNDPTAFVDIYYSPGKETIYILDESYVTGQKNRDIADMLHEKTANKNITTCDSEDPRTISELEDMDCYVTGAIKGPDSVRHGISWIQARKIVIDVKCQNFKNEIQKYKWKEDKNGVVLKDPVDKDNHLLDAMRYALEEEMLNRKITAGRRIR